MDLDCCPLKISDELFSTSLLARVDVHRPGLHGLVFRIVFQALCFPDGIVGADYCPLALQCPHGKQVALLRRDGFRGASKGFLALPGLQ